MLWGYRHPNSMMWLTRGGQPWRWPHQTECFRSSSRQPPWLRLYSQRYRRAVQGDSRICSWPPWDQTQEPQGQPGEIVAAHQRGGHTPTRTTPKDSGSPQTDSPFGRAAAAAAVQDPEAPEESEVAEDRDLSLGGPELLGRLEQCREWWDRFAKDAFVREAVRGHRLEVESRPPVSRPKPPPVESMNKEREKVLQEEVDSLLSKGAVERVKDRKRSFYSNIFLLAKKDGGLRPVINLSGLNMYIKKKIFWMASLKDESQSLHRGDWAATIDPKDAYLHVPIAAQHRRFLRFWWKGSSYQFRRLPFGLSSAPRTFTRLTLPLVTLCRANGVRIIVYLDDFLVLACSRPELLCHTRLVLDILEKAGFQRNPKEGSLGAKTALRVSWAPVGYEGAEGLPTRGQDQRLQAVRTQATLQPQSSLGPKISGQGYLCSPGRTVGPDVPATTSDGSNKGVEVGSTGPQQRCQGVDKMVDSTPYECYGFDAIQHTNSHDHGRVHLWMGSDHGREIGQRQMVGRREDLHINHLELLAVFRGVQRFLRHLRNKRVTVPLDNFTAAAYLAKEGGTRSETLSALTKEILIFCREYGFALSPAYLPGIANLGADALSRGTEKREWFINPRVSERIFSCLGLPQIDLFASRRSAQVKTYFSLDRRDNHSAGTNALNQSWTFKHMYASPPPQIIPLILGRMRECKGTLILVTPFWSRAVWLPELLQMAVRAPFRLPQHPSTVRDLSTGDLSHRCRNWSWRFGSYAGNIQSPGGR